MSAAAGVRVSQTEMTSVCATATLKTLKETHTHTKKGPMCFAEAIETAFLASMELLPMKHLRKLELVLLLPG